MRPTDAQLDWLQSAYVDGAARPRKGVNVPPRTRDIAAAFRRRFRRPASAQWIAAVLRSHFRGWPSERQPQLLTWSQARYVRERYPEVPLRRVAEEIDRRWGLDVSVRQLKWWTSSRGITTGGARDGRLRPGEVLPENTVPVGTVRVRHDRGSRELFVKVAARHPYTGRPGHMRPLRLVAWEREFGPVSPGCCVVQLDGDWRNCDVDNLECVTRAELARLNQMRWRRLPADRETRLAAVAAARLKQQAFRLAPSPATLAARRREARRVGEEA